MKKDDKLNYSLINRFLGVFLPIVLLYFVTNIFNDLNLAPFIQRLLDVLNPIFIALVITWILNPLVKFLESKGIRKALATFIAFFIFFLSIYLLFSLFIPVVAKQIVEFVNYMPTIQKSIEEFISSVISNYTNSNAELVSLEEQFISTISGLLSDIGSYLMTLSTGVYDILSSFLGAVFNFFFALMISFYLLYDYDRVMGNIVKIFPDKYQNSVDYMVNEFTQIIGNYIRSYSLISLIVTVLVYIAFSLQGLSSPLVLALIVGVFNFIPIIGPFVGAFPAMLVALSMGLGPAIITLIVITVIQQIDANILKPLLMGKSTNLHPLIIIVSVMVFGKFFGIVGILVAIPVTAFFNSLIHFLGAKGITVGTIFIPKEDREETNT